MEIQDRIKNNIEYFRGLDIDGGLYILKVQLKPKWSVFPSADGLIKVAKSEDTENEYYYYAKIEESNLDDMFALLESTVAMNIEANLKIQLMLEKIEELKTLFANNPLDRLKTLEFSFKEAIEKKEKPKRKYNKKKKEETTEEPIIEEENNTEEEKVETNA